MMHLNNSIQIVENFQSHMPIASLLLSRNMAIEYFYRPDKTSGLLLAYCIVDIS